MIAPKADSGFFLMAARRGFAEQEGLKIEVVDVKDDQVGMRALLAGEVDSFDTATGGDDRGCARCRYQIRGLPLAGGPLRGAGAPGHLEDGGAQGQDRCGLGARDPARYRGARLAGSLQGADQEVKFAAVGSDRDRYNALLGGIVDAAVVANEYLPLPSSKSLSLLAEARQVLPQWVRFCTVMNGNARRHGVPTRSRS